MLFRSFSARKEIARVLMHGLELIALDVAPGVAMESQSGLQMNRPRVYGALAGPKRGRIGAIVMHPTSNFMGHYLLEPFAQRGIGLLALNSRYVGNDSVLIMERVLQDLGAGVAYLRQHYDRVILIGNSGGAALMSFYQAQAEQLTLKDTPAGDPLHITPEELPPADGVALMAGHIGRSRLLLNWLDASLTDERDPLSCDPALDIYDARNAPPFSADFVARIRAVQRQRSERITAQVKARLKFLRSLPHGPRDSGEHVTLGHAASAHPLVHALAAFSRGVNLRDANRVVAARDEHPIGRGAKDGAWHS